jgi:hypothetical protein
VNFGAEWTTKTRACWNLSHETGEIIRKSRFMKSQVVAISKKGEARGPVAELARRRGISRAVEQRPHSGFWKFFDRMQIEAYP